MAKVVAGVDRRLPGGGVHGGNIREATAKEYAWDGDGYGLYTAGCVSNDADFIGKGILSAESAAHLAAC